MKLFFRLAALAILVVPAMGDEFPKTVTVKVGSDVGTSNDQAGRLLAAYIGRYLPGAPQVAVENVPGASGARLAHQMVVSEPKDGSVLGLVATDLVRSHVTDPSSMDFDPSNLEWVGALVAPVQLCVTSKQSPISLADLGSEDTKFGASVPNSSLYSYSAVLRYLNHGKFRIVLGFKNELDLMAALDRGEINGYCGETYSTYQREGREATQTIIAGLGDPTRLKDLGIHDMAEGLTGADAAAVDLLRISTKAYYSFALPAGTPGSVLAQHRAAFDRAVTDPALQTDVQAQFREFAPTTGAQLEAIVAAAVHTDPAVVERAHEMLR